MPELSLLHHSLTVSLGLSAFIYLQKELLLPLISLFSLISSPSLPSLFSLFSHPHFFFTKRHYKESYYPTKSILKAATQSITESKLYSRFRQKVPTAKKLFHLRQWKIGCYAWEEGNNGHTMHSLEISRQEGGKELICPNSDSLLKQTVLMLCFQ